MFLLVLFDCYRISTGETNLNFASPTLIEGNDATLRNRTSEGRVRNPNLLYCCVSRSS